MAKTGLTVADMDLIEANEAFAAQSVAVSQALDLSLIHISPMMTETSSALGNLKIRQPI